MPGLRGQPVTVNGPGSTAGRTPCASRMVRRVRSNPTVCLMTTALLAGAVTLHAQPPRAAEKAGYSGPAPTDRSAAALYKAYCFNCHGERMLGDGPLAPLLSTPVRNLHQGMRLSSSVEGHLFTAGDVAVVVERGVPGTPMASLAGLFTKPELLALSRHVVSLAGWEPAAPAMDLGPVLDLTPDNVMEGAVIYARSGCTSCHGVDGHGGFNPGVTKTNEDGSPARFPTLHQPVTWRGGPGAKEVALRVAKGMPGTPMPAYRPMLKDKELMLLGLYVESLAQVTTLTQLAQQWVVKGDDSNALQRGNHLLQTLGCAYCHRQDGGAFPVNVGPLGGYVAGPLLPKSLGNDPGELSAALYAAVTSGTGYDGRKLMPLAMPWAHLESFTPADADALTAALLTRPRAAQAGPAPRHASWLSQVLGKFSAAGKVTVLEMRLGGASGDVLEDGPSPRVVGLATLAASLGVFFFMLMAAVGGPKRSRSRRTLVAFIPLPVGVALSVLMVWPAYDLRPNFTVRLGMGAQLPQPTISDDVTGALAKKGRTLVGAAGCALCHTVVNPYRLASSPPLSGGARLRGAGFGRVYAGNLTGHAGTGLGTWTREEVRRAVKGGVGKDGRVFHWEAMPYNLSGAWSDEELEAVVTYLMALPPVDHKVPAPEGGDDLDAVGLSLFDHTED